MLPKYRVITTSDRAVVLIKSSFDRVVGRFSPQGYEIFNDSSSGGILVSKSGRRFTQTSWSQFRMDVKERYDLDVPVNSFDLSILPESL